MSRRANRRSYSVSEGVAGTESVDIDESGLHLVSKWR